MCYLTNLRFHHIWFSITFSLHTLAWLTVIRCESDLSENEKINCKRTQNHVLPLNFQIHFLEQPALSQMNTEQVFNYRNWKAVIPESNPPLVFPGPQKEM